MENDSEIGKRSTIIKDYYTIVKEYIMMVQVPSFVYTYCGASANEIGLSSPED